MQQQSKNGQITSINTSPKINGAINTIVPTPFLDNYDDSAEISRFIRPFTITVEFAWR